MYPYSLVETTVTQLPTQTVTPVRRTYIYSPYFTGIANANTSNLNDNKDRQEKHVLFRVA